MCQKVLITRLCIVLAMTAVLFQLSFSGIAAEKKAPPVNSVNAPVTVPNDWSPTVNIDATVQRDPISPYIYGQFIEHLGRCIYGGIWAELLEDRKFYESVDTDASPWKLLSRSGKVRMNEKDPWVGKWTPELSARPFTNSFRLVQKNLLLKSGVDYNGYLVVKVSEGISSVKVGIATTKADDTCREVRFKVGEKGDLQSNKYTKLKFLFPYKSEKLKSPVTFYIGAEGSGTIAVGCASLMPSDNIDGMRADTLQLLRELNSPVYRWPGGNFVSGYNWKDGIGDRDRRPPRKNPAWEGIEHNDFGFDEFMRFCAILKTEPYIAINTGSGDLKSALEELEYSNGSAETAYGQKRAQNGHADPYKVRFWCIGNEMYGSWQIGFMPVEEYVKKHNLFVDAYRKADKNILVVGVGNVGKWNDVFIPGAFGHLDYLSEHFYVRESPDLVAHTRLTVDSVKRIDDAHDGYEKKWPELFDGKKLKVIMDEWNYWYGPEVFGQIGTRYYLRDGLGIAAGLHEFYRRSDRYFMANYAQTVNVIGAIKTNPVNAEFESTGLVLKLYRNKYGTEPIDVRLDGDFSGPRKNLLDVAAALTKDRSAMTVGIVNAAGSDINVKLNVKGVKIAGNATMYVIADRENDQRAFNDPGQPQRISLKEKKIELANGTIRVPKLSVSLVKVALVK